MSVKPHLGIFAPGIFAPLPAKENFEPPKNDYGSRGRSHANQSRWDGRRHGRRHRCREENTAEVRSKYTAVIAFVAPSAFLVVHTHEGIFYEAEAVAAFGAGHHIEDGIMGYARGTICDSTEVHVVAIRRFVAKEMTSVAVDCRGIRD